MADHYIPLSKFIPRMREVVLTAEPGDVIYVCEEDVRNLVADNMFKRLRPGFDVSQVRVVVDPERVNREMEAEA